MLHKIIAPLATIVFMCINLGLNAQTWRQSQIDSANTAKSIAYISAIEKEAILYINLCRLYPQDFVKYELNMYEPNELLSAEFKQNFKKYKATLVSKLTVLKPCGALSFDSLLYVDATCYAKEISTNFREPHERKICPQSKYDECIAFGVENGKEIAIDLLVDTDVPSLGHRKILLDSKYNKIGVRHNTHYEYENCAVLELYY